ncbi:MAG: bifunctional DNA primase/polymerase, partial [Thermoguttaceae bacterium]
MTVFQEILTIADKGYKLFPLLPNRKMPLISGWKDAATCDASKLNNWAAEYPGCNWGLHCDGVVVIDVDRISELGNPFAGRADFENVPSQITPGVGKLLDADKKSLGDSPGRQYFFQRPAGKQWENKNGKYAKNIDIKTNNGYVVISPSAIDGKCYEWTTPLTHVSDLPTLPEDCIRRLDEINVKKPPQNEVAAQYT